MDDLEHAQPNPSRRSDQKEATRRALVRAALDRFDRRGYAATSIADITAAAGVAKGTFYVHFESKEALLDGELAVFNAALASELVRAVATLPADPLETLVRAISERALAHFLAHRPFVKAYAERSTFGLDVTALPFGINPEVRQVLAPILAAKFPAMPERETELVVHGVLALFLRLLLSAVFRDDVEPEDVVAVLVRMTTGALSAYADDPKRGLP